MSATRRSSPAAFVPPDVRPETASAWRVGDYKLVRRLDVQAVAARAADAAAAAAELRRLQLEPLTLAYGLGSTLLLLLAWAWALSSRV